MRLSRLCLVYAIVCQPVLATTKGACRGVLPFELVRADGAGFKRILSLYALAAPKVLD